MKTEFKERIRSKIVSSIGNNHKDNYDYYRFGYKKVGFNLKDILRKFLIERNYIARWKTESHWLTGTDIFINHIDKLDKLYNLLQNEPSRNLLVDVLAYRILGHSFVKLKTNKQDYWESIKKIEKLKIEESDFVETAFNKQRLYNYDLKPIGADVSIYYNPQGIVTDFLLEQYAYRSNSVNISAEKGDFVIDAGGCWGDTALYFASKVDSTGRVFSFEFIPENIRIWEKNIMENKRISDIVELIDKPLWGEAGVKVFYKDKGPGSIVSFNDFDGSTGSTETQTIDKMVEENDVKRIDLIKMDIEGAEFNALQGAMKTIRRFRPKLAIAIYHDLEDFSRIPLWISELNLGYKFYLDHFTIHQEETILFAITD